MDAENSHRNLFGANSSLLCPLVPFPKMEDIQKAKQFSDTDLSVSGFNLSLPNIDSPCHSSQSPLLSVLDLPGSMPLLFPSICINNSSDSVDNNNNNNNDNNSNNDNNNNIKLEFIDDNTLPSFCIPSPKPTVEIIVRAKQKKIERLQATEDWSFYFEELTKIYNENDKQLPSIRAVMKQFKIGFPKAKDILTTWAKDYLGKSVNFIPT
ncbi:SAC3/GANP family protein [Reticulomyxa filosa]|uniref:SAC3/GANP family protein n=1 Tax=Reticulomyxa filosa TaxID=46433 RepID=X6NVS5_RETFI|nr:SAC3/GANP family protein [Reticulomyxa filosa]|eukprot:ETO30390.1 SAC3/GANP family protein [Reticulomyxa filosa]